MASTDGPDRRERRGRAPDQPHRPGRLRLPQPAHCKAADRGFFDGNRQGLRQKGKTESSSTKDEHPRGDTTMETLSKLPAAFRDGGSVTANSSGHERRRLRHDHHSGRREDVA